MKHPWPETPHTDVAVFVDWMNVFLSRLNLYQGKFSVDIALECINRLAKTVGRRPQIAIYLNTDVFRQRHPVSWIELIFYADEIGAQIVHVPNRHNRDDVDGVIIHDLLEVNRHPNKSAPFLVISRDIDFEATIERVSSDRPIFVGLPSAARVSNLRRVSSCRWIDPWAGRHMAAWDILNPESTTTENYIQGQRKRMKEYDQAIKSIELIAESLSQFPPGVSFDYVLQQLRHEHQNQSLTQADWAYYLKAFEYYDLIRNWRDGLRLRRNHPAYNYFGIEFPKPTLTLIATRP